MRSYSLASRKLRSVPTLRRAFRVDQDREHGRRNGIFEVVVYIHATEYAEVDLQGYASFRSAPSGRCSRGETREGCDVAEGRASGCAEVLGEQSEHL